MKDLIITILTFFGNAIALLITSYLVAPILPNNDFVVTNFTSAIIAMAIMTVIHILLGRILQFIFTIPTNLLSFALLVVVFNMALFVLASNLTPGGGFRITSFPAAVIGLVIFLSISSIMTLLIHLVCSISIDHTSNS